LQEMVYYENDEHHLLETLGTSLFHTEDAVATVSAAAGLLALACHLGRPGTLALVPGWICSEVFHVLILAGLRPSPVDVEKDFTMSLQAAERISAKVGAEISLVVYAPFGGHAPDFEDWLKWAQQRQVTLIADLVQSPDLEVWQKIAPRVTAAITSFRSGKPLGASGGGLIAGRQMVIEAARTFFNAGRDRRGRKVSLGVNLSLAAEAAEAARRRLARQVQLCTEWRALTRKKLLAAEAWCLPGWTQSSHALSKIPCLQGPGRPLNPDATYRSSVWRQAVRERFGAVADEPLPNLEALYEKIRVIYINVEQRDSGGYYEGKLL
jgi:dTDP-4-amino-4,6-dideoxygalactose transaminase